MRLNLKRFVWTIMLLGVVTAFTPVTAQVTSVSLTIPNDSSGYPGDIVRIPIILDTDLTSENIIAFKLEFSYGAELTPVAVVNAGSMTSSWNLLLSTTAANRFAITAAGVEALSGTGNLFYVDFELGNVTSQRSSAISLFTSTNAQNYFNEGGYTVSAENGHITISPVPTLSVSVNDYTLTRGQSATISVSGGTPPYTYTVTDEDIASIVNGNMVQGDNSGFVKVEVEDANGVRGTSPNFIQVYGYEISFAAPSDMKSEDTVLIDVTTTDVADLNIIAGSFNIGMTSNMQFLEAVVEGTLLESHSVQSNIVNATTRKFAFAGSSPLGAGTVLMKLKVKINPSVSNGNLYFTARQMIFNEDLEGNYVDQGFSFQGLPIPVVSGSANNLIPGEQYQFNVSGGTPPYTWSVSDPSVASISETGLLTVLKGGPVKVSVTDAENQEAFSSTFTMLDGEINLPEHVTPGNLVYDYPIYITDLPTGRDALGYSFTFRLTTADVEFVEVVKAGTLSENFFITVNDSDADDIRVAAAGEAGFASAGILCYIRLQLKADLTLNETTYFSLVNVAFNEGTPALRINNGTIRIGPTPPVAADVAAVADEDTQFFFTPEMFNYSQVDGNPFTSIIIDQVPANGKLFYSTSQLGVNSTINVANFNLFYFLAAPNTSGTPYDSFRFRVYDGNNYSYESYKFSFDVTPLNDPPTFTLSETTVVRDQDFEEPIVITPALDVPADEVGETVSFSIDPASVEFASVSIDATTGIVSVESIPGLFGTQTFTVTADDNHSTDSAYQQTFTLTVNKVNAAPVITAQQFSIAENATPGLVVDTVLATDANNDALTYSIISGNTSNAFSVNATTGILVVQAALDFETSPLYELTISVSDGTASAEAVISVDIIDVDEVNTPVINNQTFNVSENTVTGFGIGTVVASDPNGDALTFAIESGNTGGAFSINGSTGELTIADSASVDYETNPTFNIVVSVTDGALSSSAVITINVSDVYENLPPVIADQNFSINENSVTNEFVGDVVASDPNGNSLSFSITAGNNFGAFSIIASTGRILVSNPIELDFETNPVFNLTVEVSDGELTSSAVVTVSLNDVNEDSAPVITPNQSFSIAENSTAGTVVGTVAASDPDSDPLSYSLGFGNVDNAFAISSSGEITVANPMAVDFETTPQFVITVSVSDGTTASHASVVIDVADVFENVAPSIADQAFSVMENSVAGTVVGTVAASDADGNALAFAIDFGNTDNAFAINVSSGEITVSNSAVLDFEATTAFVLMVSVSDGTVSSSAVVTINITNENENAAPVISSQNFSVGETAPVNTIIGNVIASDAENDPLTFSISSGNTDGKFALTTTGELSVAATLDAEIQSQYNLVVQVTDGNHTSEAIVTVDVVDNAAPVVADQVFSIEETASINAVIGTISASDQENDPLSYTIVSGNENNKFALSASGELTLAAKVDFETQSQYSLTIGVTDGNQTTEASVTINVTDGPENQSPVIVVEIPDVDIDEDEDLSVLIASLMDFFQDPENAGLTFEVLSSNAEILVSVNGSEVSVDIPADYFGVSTITVIASDGDLFVDDSFVLTINSVNDAPEFSFNRSVVDVSQDFETAETVVVNAGFVPDNEADQSVTYSLSPSSVDFANVSIDAATGLVTITAVDGAFGEQVFTVTADDGQAENAQFTQTFELLVKLITGVEDPNASAFTVYPNPARETVTVEAPFNSYNLMIHDVKGQMFLSNRIEGGKTSVNVSSLPVGLYFVKISAERKSYYQKLFIK